MGEDEDMERFEERTDEAGGRRTEGSAAGSKAADRAGAPVAPQGRVVWPLAVSSHGRARSAGSCGDRASMDAGGSSSSCVRLVPSRPGRAVRAVHRVLERRGHGPGAGVGAGSVSGDAGAATAEYAIATMAAVAFAGLLVVILQSDEVRGMLLDLVRRALTYDR
jgi:hypothetical protein